MFTNFRYQIPEYKKGHRRRGQRFGDWCKPGFIPESILLDDEDHKAQGVHHWRINKVREGFVYAVRQYLIDGKKTRIYLHRVIAGAKPGEVVDHINGNTIDNRRSNLRIVTRCENVQNHKPYATNTSGHTGVSWHKHGQKWQVIMKGNGKRVFLGSFDDVEEAGRIARAYREANYSGYTGRA